ncbi:MAG: glutaminyl-peptide cyclotransferase [Aridibacter sp.]
MRFYFLLLSALLLFSCNGSSPTSVDNTNPVNNNSNVTTSENSVNPAAVPSYDYEIVKEYKHDSDAFTQGLVFNNGFLYESTGQYGDSTLRKVEIETGKVLQKQDVPKEYFAEGLTILNDKLYQVTWREEKGFVYNLSDLKLTSEFRYSGEGWGLTNDGTNLILSDGTHVIRFINPETFETVRTIVVKDEKDQPLLKINELEYVKGEIWANIWHSEEINKPNHIARINPADGKLLGWINLNGISPDDEKRDSENTLNGIAYDEAGDRIFVTGKHWKKLFEIKVTPKS